MLNFAQRLALLKHSLREKGIRQETLAKKLKCSPSTISNTLSGSKETSMVFLLQVLKEADYPLDQVFPDIKEQLSEIIGLLEKGENQEATINLLNLLRLTYNHGQNEARDNTKTAS
tara:strand:- start:2114 stop:2461 length:348 start_codon:yes stop_codon:yes gene_type:complete